MEQKSGVGTGDLRIWNTTVPLRSENSFSTPTTTILITKEVGIYLQLNNVIPCKSLLILKFRYVIIRTVPSFKNYVYFSLYGFMSLII